MKKESGIDHPEAMRDKEFRKSDETKPAQEVAEEPTIENEAEREEAIGQVRDEIASIALNKKQSKWPMDQKVIILSEEDQAVMAKAAERIQKADRFIAPALFKGNKTAAEYDSKACNFSTKTNIAELLDGRKVFIVHNYKMTGIHRWLDGTMKHLTGYPMRKATRAQWKERFENKSNLPIIPIDNPEMVAMPYVPNLNLDDLFCRQKEIKDFGECGFAKDMGEEDLLNVLGKLSDKLNQFHKKGSGWGEVNLGNTIIDKDQEVHICDPEVAYDEGVLPADQKAYDLLDLITSSCTSLEGSYGTGYEKVVASILDKYGDSEALDALKKLAVRSVTFKEKLFFGYSQARLRLKSLEQMSAIRQAISDYLA